jgi:integrase
MARKWTRLAHGIRVRDHATRRHGVKPDRYFTLRFSVDGRQIEEALGWASAGWTLARAQEELGRLREAKRTGQGPATLRARAEDHRRTERRRVEEEETRARLQRTMADLWDRYRKEVIAVVNKPRTAADKVELWETRVGPAIGALKIEAVTEEDVSAVVRAPLRLNASGRVIGGKGRAGYLYRFLHHLFSKALAWGLRPKTLGNPLDNIAEPKVARRERLFTGTEIGALLATLDRAALDRTEEPQAVAAIRAAIFTGARIGELLTLRWEDIRRDEMAIHFADTKTGFSRRPMSAETLAVLDSVERMPGVSFVFRSVKDPNRSLPYNTVEKVFRRIVARAGIENCTLHTIRHWVATMTANTVSNPRVGMAITGHKSHAAYMHYVHGDKEQARALAEQLATLATGLARGGSNVTDLPRREGAR